MSSAGGHLAQVLEMDSIFKKFEYLIVTENIQGTTHLEGEFNMKYLKPTTRERDLMFWCNFFVNFYKTFFILLRFKPNVIITTGSNIVVPFCYLGKIMNKKIIYILTYARINSRAKAADLIYPIADVFIVQWESAKKFYPKAKFLGGGLY